MLEDKVVTALQRHWEDGFNRYDVDLVLEPVDQDVVFSSPFVPRLTGDPEKVTIDGYDAFRAYIDDSMRRVPGIRYSIESSFVSTQTVVFVYTCHFADGQSKTGADSIRVNKAGKIVEWRCHYSFDPEAIDSLIQD
ncbi:nuclear transport factor 2 family protein [Frankia sp. CNm7]|uniref:Nuclear transport factor 2 family protein n=1 Tax=Frankia nepalensis TaxID=1836974 RepID=A0A937URB1_9ACTN|nr:nuclear transport factor 2 family protein [Frankia nepalensis]MBL7496583.1 nuclear transport factor 2 family protein [Frankia nepalensis]MBL7508802.1 nuclear transport factor 2 family protein [Frankia nepalensis]MBL7520216.1 nuclear transport factor 2 family protein [Frankia nepalensis]MBL7627556.1 nuclear transport factor 2 family protein [Frankia nepalensis]